MTTDKKQKKEEAKDLKEVINQLRQEVEQWKSKYLRALADYQNLEKRVNQEMISFQKKAGVKLLLKFLEVLDLIEKAEIFIKDEGLRLVKEKFLTILREEGVSEIELLGKVYDPHLAECIEVVKGKRDNIIVEVVKKGYQIDKEIIRIAKVKVEKNVNS